MDGHAYPFTNEALMFENAQVVRQKLTYFAVYETPEGRIEVTIRKEPASSGGKPDTTASARLFDRTQVDRYGGFWHWIASLNYNEIDSREISLAGDLTERKLATMRADAEFLLLRSLAILDPGEYRQYAQSVISLEEYEAA